MALWYKELAIGMIAISGVEIYRMTGTRQASWQEEGRADPSSHPLFPVLLLEGLPGRNVICRIPTPAPQSRLEGWT
jgi:hypothetical protein